MSASIDRVARARRNLREARRVEVCPECGGASVERCETGGIARRGPCRTCHGTGLMLR